MRRSLAVGVMALVLGLAGGADATESVIRPGVGIGKIKLGMSVAQVRHVLGGDALTSASDGRYKEFQWDFAAWTVGFIDGHAVLVDTELRNQRTDKRIGPGSTWLALMRAHPGGRCTENVNDQVMTTQMWPEYLITNKAGAQTLFVFKTIINQATPTVRDVVVRTRFKPLPQFASTWPWYCDGDWRHARTPEVKVKKP